MEACEPPFSARAVAAMSRQTDAGELIPIRVVCKVFGISQAAYYAARKATAVDGDRPRGRRTEHSSTAALNTAIKAIVEVNPAWGVRKVWATLRRAPWSLRVGRRRVHALMRAMALCLPCERSDEPLPRLGTVAVAEPNRRWATDLTTVWTDEDGLVAVVPVVDCGCRSILALSVTKAQDAAAVLAPVRVSLVDAFGRVDNVPDGLELRSDHGPQYTGSDCEDLCTEWNIHHTMSGIGRPTGNAVAERVIRTMKEECIWLRDWRSRAELEAALTTWRQKYNDERPHQSLRWQTPSEVRHQHLRLERLAA